MSADAIVKALTADELQTQWAESISLMPEIDSAGQKRCLAEISKRRDEFLALVSEIEDAEEIEVVVAIKYIETKSQWIMLNTLVNYQNFRRGSCEPEQMLRASLTSRLLATIEDLVSKKDLDTITQFLAEPVART